VNKAYYRIKKIPIANELVSFDLHPLEFNKLTNIKKQSNSIENLRDITFANSKDDFNLKSPTKLTVDELYNYFNEL
jgi:hypothetical protein